MKTASGLPSLFSFQAPPGWDPGRSDSPVRRLRIAFLAPEDRRTGTYFRYHNLAVALARLGHSVTVYSQSSENRIRDQREFRDGVPYVLSATVPGNRWMLPPTNPGTFLRRLTTTIDPADVYHLFQPFPSAALCWLWLKRTRPGVFAYDWDDFWINEEFGLKNPRGFRARWAAFWIKRLERKLPLLADLTTVVSRPLGELAQSWGCRRPVVFYNGVWPRPPGDKQAARTALNLRPDAFYVGLMGWTGEIDWCLDAIRRYAPVYPDLRLAITGLNPSRRLRAYRDISARIDALGALPPEKFTHFTGCLDLGLVPMRVSDFNRYRLPFKLTDHLAGGVPVLCSRIGEAARLAGDLDGIYTCPPTREGWLTAFGTIIEFLAEHPNARRPSQERLFKRFGWPRIASDISALYTDALRVQNRSGDRADAR